MKIKKFHILGIIFALIIIAGSMVFLREEKIFYFLIGLSVVVGILPFIVSVVSEGKKEKENNEMFLEFSRNLVENVKAGTPISKAIMMLKDKNYGTLTQHIKKLANQISIGIPVKDAFEIFSRDINSKVINRAVTLISEAEKAGGEIEGILESVAKSVSEIEKLKKERQNVMYSLVVQGYMIFFIFIVIMLIMQFKILPMTSEISGAGMSLQDLNNLKPEMNVEDVSKPMMYLLLVQGLFTGLIIGKLSEGTFKAGIKHSFVMLALSILIYAGAGVFLG